MVTDPLKPLEPGPVLTEARFNWTSHSHLQRSGALLLYWIHPKWRSPSAVDCLKVLAAQLELDKPGNLVNVYRGDVLDGTCRAFRRESFQPRRKLFVKFSSGKGIDDGGPRRELMRLVMQRIKESPIFEGTGDSKMLSLDYRSLQNGTYKLYGKILAYCLVHGGPAPAFFSNLLFALCCGTIPTCVEMSYGIDQNNKEMLEKFRNADEETFTSLIQMNDTLLECAGCSSIANYDNKIELAEALQKFLAVYRKGEAIKQFIEGLKCLGVADSMASMKELFVFSEVTNRKLTAFQLIERFEFESVSPAGSTRATKESRIEAFFSDLIWELEEQELIGDLLTFITGADEELPLGFDPPLRATFGHPQDAENDPRMPFPFANSCFNSIRIPVLETYTIFRTHMINTILTVKEFGDY